MACLENLRVLSFKDQPNACDVINVLGTISKNKIPYVLALVLLAWLTIAPILTSALTFTSQSPQSTQLIIQTTCAKRVQVQTLKLCQLNKLQYYVDTSYLLFLLKSSTGKLFFNYFSSLISILFLSQIYKPPKLNFAFT